MPGTEVAVLPDEAPYAYALPGGRRDRVVVTTALLDCLEPAERRALFAHLQRLSLGFYERNRAGVVISRLRLDSPFTFLTGTVEFEVTDDSPDIEIFDIDSDTDASAGIEAGYVGTGNASITSDPDFAEVDFSLDEVISFDCEENGFPPFPADPTAEDECVDVDVVLGPVTPGENEAGQTLSEMGFTITPGAAVCVSATIARPSSVVTVPRSPT